MQGNIFIYSWWLPIIFPLSHLSAAHVEKESESKVTRRFGVIMFNGVAINSFSLSFLLSHAVMLLKTSSNSTESKMKQNNTK